MSLSKLKQEIKRVGCDLLIKHNFLQSTPFVFHREEPGLLQGIEFQKGTKWLKEKFTVNLFWRYKTGPITHDFAMDYAQRIGQLMSGYDEWFSYKEEDIECSFQVIERILIEKVLPIFNKYKKIETIMEEFESNNIDPGIYFGIEEGWRLYNIGYNYLYLGEKNKAKKYLLDLVREHSHYNIDWVKERKMVVEKTLSCFK